MKKNKMAHPLLDILLAFLFMAGLFLMALCGRSCREEQNKAYSDNTLYGYRYQEVNSPVGVSYNYN